MLFGIFVSAGQKMLFGLFVNLGCFERKHLGCVKNTIVVFHKLATLVLLQFLNYASEFSDHFSSLSKRITKHFCT